MPLTLYGSLTLTPITTLCQTAHIGTCLTWKGVEGGEDETPWYEHPAVIFLFAVGGIVGAIGAILGALKCLGTSARDVLRRLRGHEEETLAQDGDHRVRNGGNVSNVGDNAVHTIGNGNITNVFTSPLQTREVLEIL